MSDVQSRKIHWPEKKKKEREKQEIKSTCFPSCGVLKKISKRKDN